MTFFNVIFWFFLLIFSLGAALWRSPFKILFIMPINPTSRVFSGVSPFSASGYTPSYDWSSVQWDKYNPYYNEDMAKLIWDSDKSIIRTNRSLAETEAQLWQAANNFQSNLYGSQLERETQANAAFGINTNLEGVKSQPNESEFDPSTFGNGGNERLGQVFQSVNDFLGSFSSVIQTGLGIIQTMGASPQQLFTNDLQMMSALGGFPALAERSMPSVIVKNLQTGNWEYDPTRASTWLRDIGYRSPFVRNMVSTALDEYFLSQKGVNTVIKNQNEGKEAVLNPITNATDKYMKNMSKIYKLCWDLNLSSSLFESKYRVLNGYADLTQAQINAKLWKNKDFRGNYYSAAFDQQENDALNLKFVNSFRNSVNDLFEGLFKAAQSNDWAKSKAAQATIVAAGGILLPMLQQSKFSFGAFLRPGSGNNFQFNNTAINQ